MRIDDFICLGRTVPEESKKYGHKVCMAGYSEELHGLVRIYPLPVVNPVRVRRRCVLEVERNPMDSRSESWKLKDCGQSIVSVSDSEVPMCDLVVTLRRRASESIAELNRGRFSLGVIEVKGQCQGFFLRRAEVRHPSELTLFDFADSDPRFGANALDIIPKLGFYDQAMKWHELQLREWGCYEWVRKHREAAERLWENLDLRSDRPTILVVGNMANHRNVWLVIKVFKAHEHQRSLFDCLPNDSELFSKESS